MKKLFYIMGLVLLMASCSEDFEDWVNPQHNDPAPLQAELTVTEAPAIDFATLEDDVVNIFSPDLNVKESDEVEYTVTLANGDVTVDVTTDAEGNVSAADLKEAVETLYGKAPTPREIAAKITRVKINGQSFSTEKDFTVFVTLVAPHISENYYVIGGSLDWAVSAATKQQKFNHSDVNVFDDPIFTITIDAKFDDNGNREDTWFAFADDEACEAVMNDDWSKLIGTTLGDGSTELTGGLATRVELGHNGGICMPASDNAVAYKITLNMMEYTYTIEPVSAEPEQWYLIGSCIGNGTWANNSVNDVGFSLFPLTNIGEGLVSYVGYFQANSGFKLIKTPGSWDDQWGMAEGEYVKNNGSSGDIKVNADGYYRVTLNTIEDELTIEPTSAPSNTYTQMGVAGSFSGWSFKAMAACPGSSHLWRYELNTEDSDVELKFLTDSSWSTNWGAKAFPQGIGSQNGDNIPVPAGMYIIIFNDITGGYNFIPASWK